MQTGLPISKIALVLANLLPLYGVLALGWDLGFLLLLYWSESAIIGVSNVIKMATARPSEKNPTAAKIFMIPFFCFHYGMFMFVHLMFLMMIIGMLNDAEAVGPAKTFPFSIFQQILPAFLALVVSHTLSLFVNYFGKQKWKTTTIDKLFGAPYPRIIVMHVTIVLGMFASFIFGQNLGFLLLFIALKIITDLGGHIFEHTQQNSLKSLRKSKV